MLQPADRTRQKRSVLHPPDNERRRLDDSRLGPRSDPIRRPRIGNRRSGMKIIERRIAVIGAVVIEPARGGARLRPRINPGPAILFGVTATLHLGVHEPAVCAAYGRFPSVLL